MDIYTKEKRSEVMSKVRSKNTNPELIVRQLIFGMGYRYRLHVASLPGKPDIVMSKRRKIIEVRGCFWHAHEGCKHATLPKTRTDFWATKIACNRERDKKNLDWLNESGWEVLIVWQCELKQLDALKSKLKKFIDSE